MQKGIAVAGSLIVDDIKYIEAYPGQQALTTITSMERSAGGLVSNCVIDLARLDPALPVIPHGHVPRA